MMNAESKSDEKLKIAIVGAGISGCSCAYFLNNEFGDNVEITVFEKSNKIGGRLDTVNFNNRDYELGGSILHSSNLYMKQFLKYLDLEKRCDDKDSDTYVGFYDSNGILISMDGSFFGIMDKIRMFNYFGFFQLIRFTRWIETFLEKFSRIYKVQEAGRTFRNNQSFCSELDLALLDASNMSISKALKEKGFNKRIINHLTNVACLSNYGQSNKIDGFVGLVSICGTVGDLWSVKSGNKKIPEKLLEKSGAKVLKNTCIKSISKSTDNPESKNTIVYQTSDCKEIIDDSFDYVIVGFPIYNGVLGDDFKLDFDTHTDFDNYEMQRTNTYFINGIVKLFPDTLPKTKRIDLHSVDPAIPYRCVCVNLPCDYNQAEDSDLYLGPGAKLFKIFAEVDLTKKNFDNIFEEGYEIVKEMPWLAYPKYHENQPTTKIIPDIILDSEERQRVFYLNAMEWTSSCMEISCISARNISLLVANKEKQLKDKKSKKFFNKTFMKEEFFTKNSLLHGACSVLSILSIIAFAVAYFYRN